MLLMFENWRNDWVHYFMFGMFPVISLDSLQNIYVFFYIKLHDNDKVIGVYRNINNNGLLCIAYIERSSAGIWHLAPMATLPDVNITVGQELLLCTVFLTKRVQVFPGGLTNVWIQFLFVLRILNILYCISMLLSTINLLYYHCWHTHKILCLFLQTATE